MPRLFLPWSKLCATPRRRSRRLARARGASRDQPPPTRLLPGRSRRARQRSRRPPDAAPPPEREVAHEPVLVFVDEHHPRDVELDARGRPPPPSTALGHQRFGVRRDGVVDGDHGPRRPHREVVALVLDGARDAVAD